MPCESLPNLLTVAEVAAWLKTSKKSIYAQVSRGQLPGIVRVGSRVLFDESTLLSWLEEKRADHRRSC